MTSGGVYPYRTSKAALNMLTKNFAMDLAKYNVKAVTIHPGWVKTDMGGKNAEIQPQESIGGIIDLLKRDVSQEMSGAFLDYQGKVVDF